MHLVRGEDFGHHHRRFAGRVQHVHRHAAALAQLGRSGVPVYVLYAPGKAPVVMTEILTTDEVHGALSAL